MVTMLSDEIFTTENLQNACQQVSKSLLSTTAASPAALRKRREVALRLRKDSDLFVSKIRAEYLAGTVPQFTRRIIAIPKKAGEKPSRTISIFPLRQKIVFRAILNKVWPYLEPKIIPTVCFCTFRRDGIHGPRGVTSAVQCLSRERAEGSKWIFETDIASFFDDVDREQLAIRLQPLMPDHSCDVLISTLLQPVTNEIDASAMFLDFVESKGLPQGSSLSSVLACIYLEPLDVCLSQKGYLMIRYVDDLVIVSQNKQISDQAEMEVRAQIELLNLKLKENKTSHIAPGDPVTFLGHIIYPDGTIYPSEKRLKNFYLGISKIVFSLPSTEDKIVARKLASHMLSFFESESYCDRITDEWPRAAVAIKDALIKKRLQPRRLNRALSKASKKFPSEFIKNLE